METESQFSGGLALYVRESETVLDSGFHATHSEFKVKLTVRLESPFYVGSLK